MLVREESRDADGSAGASGLDHVSGILAPDKPVHDARGLRELRSSGRARSRKPEKAVERHEDSRTIDGDCDQDLFELVTIGMSEFPDIDLQVFRKFHDVTFEQNDWTDLYAGQTVEANLLEVASDSSMCTHTDEF